MRISRKSKECLNCGRTLDKVYNYCPNCGQGNHDDNVSIGILAGEFFSTYFAIDGRFGKSIKPFFFKPGYLTNQYISGKRVSYANPIRLYLIVSIFYFFIFSLGVKSTVQSGDTTDPIIASDSSDVTLNNYDQIDDSLRVKLFKNLNQTELDQLESELDNEDVEDFKKFFRELRPERQVELRGHLGDSIANRLDLITTDSLVNQKLAKEKEQDSDDINISTNLGLFEIIEDIDFEKIDKLDKEYDLTDNQIYDSLQYGELGYFDKLVVVQSIRIRRSTKETVVQYITKNLPIMMLLLIPIFALVLKLLYFKSKDLYIKHLIHALHLHSFAYLAYGIFILLTVFIINGDTSTVVTNIIGFVLVTSYAYISFLKVYKQHWFKTLVKFNIVGAVYLAIIFFFFLLEMMISLLLF